MNTYTIHINIWICKSFSSNLHRRRYFQFISRQTRRIYEGYLGLQGCRREYKLCEAGEGFWVRPENDRIRIWLSKNSKSDLQTSLQGCRRKYILCGFRRVLDLAGNYRIRIRLVIKSKSDLQTSLQGWGLCIVCLAGEGFWIWPGINRIRIRLVIKSKSVLQTS